MSYKVGIYEQPDSQPVYNGLRFETEREAQNYAKDLESRWFGFHHYEIHKTDDTPTHIFIVGNKKGLVDLHIHKPYIKNLRRF